MSEDPADYGRPKTSTASNALEDTIGAELSPANIVMLGAIVLGARRTGMSIEDLWGALCRVSPEVSDLPRKVDEEIRRRRERKQDNVVPLGSGADGPTRQHRAPGKR